MQNSTEHLPAIYVDGNLLTMDPDTSTGYQISDIDEADKAPQVIMNVNQGVATLTGWVDDDFDKASLEVATQRLNGVEQVKSYLMVCH